MIRLFPFSLPSLTACYCVRVTDQLTNEFVIATVQSTHYHSGQRVVLLHNCGRMKSKHLRPVSRVNMLLPKTKILNGDSTIISIGHRPRPTTSTTFGGIKHRRKTQHQDVPKRKKRCIKRIKANRKGRKEERQEKDSQLAHITLVSKMRTGHWTAGPLPGTIGL